MATRVPRVRCPEGIVFKGSRRPPINRARWTMWGAASGPFLVHQLNGYAGRNRLSWEVGFDWFSAGIASLFVGASAGSLAATAANVLFATRASQTAGRASSTNGSSSPRTGVDPHPPPVDAPGTTGTLESPR